MATIDELENAGELVRILVRLDPPDVSRRRLFALPAVTTWLGQTLPSVTQHNPDDISPRDQVFVLIKMFLSGEAMEEGGQFRLMQPVEDDVYELKSSDIRIFGWFYRPAVFVATSVDTMERVHTIQGLSSGHRNSVKYVRQNIDLDPPTHIEGASVSYVFSV